MSGRRVNLIFSIHPKNILDIAFPYAIDSIDSNILYRPHCARNEKHDTNSHLIKCDARIPVAIPGDTQNNLLGGNPQGQVSFYA